MNLVREVRSYGEDRSLLEEEIPFWGSVDDELTVTRDDRTLWWVTRVTGTIPLSGPPLTDCWESGPYIPPATPSSPIFARRGIPWFWPRPVTPWADRLGLGRKIRRCHRQDCQEPGQSPLRPACRGSGESPGKHHELQRGRSGETCWEYYSLMLRVRPCRRMSETGFWRCNVSVLHGVGIQSCP